MTRNHTLIIGGGLAGLAAASALGERGARVTLLESRTRLGGRASSFHDKTTGETIDNCQHVSMRCCTNFRHFCETTGSAEWLLPQQNLHFIGSDNVVNRFGGSILPAPLHLFPAFRRLSFLGSADVRSLARGVRALLRARPGDPRPFSEWLDAQRQTPAAVDRVWRVVLVSALSESLDRISVRNARKVFIDGFLANRRAWEVEIPAVPLGEFYGERLSEWLARHGTTVELGAAAVRVRIEAERATGVDLRDGRFLPADSVILAVPHHRVSDLLPEAFRDDPFLAGARQLETAPISSVHLWFDRPFTDLPHAVLVDRTSQWLFNRSELRRVPDGSSRNEAGESCYYQVVISASRDVTALGHDATCSTVLSELHSIWPAARAARLLNSRVVTEHRAVFSPTPASDTLRPPQQTPIPNLQLAGDWTRTGWPSTMEGAVRSGYLAAENVLAAAGRPERVLRPDLPVAVLSKVAQGL